MASQTEIPARKSGLVAIPPEVWRLAAVIVFGAFMANLDTSLVNVGLDTIGRRLHSPLGSTQWITSGYLIALAGALPVGAWLGRRIGVGRLWLWSLAGFTVASGLCALAPGLGVLIALRVLQGITGGLLVPAGQTVLGQAAGPARMGRMMNTVGIAVVLAPAIGPTIGGLLIAHLSWRWLFLINLPVGAVALALGLRIVPRGTTGAAGPFDPAGFALVAAGLPLLTYGIITASQDQTVTAPHVLIPLLAGVDVLQFVRGIGLGLSALPALSVAYATIAPKLLPDATAQANILQRVGGSLGSALFVVILERHGTPDLAAFHTTFWWLTVTAAIALIVASWLTVEERRARAPHPGNSAGTSQRTR